MSAWRALYSAALFAALPYALWRILRRARLSARPAPLREYFGKINPTGKTADKPVIWLHAVSVGEAAAAADLVRELRKRRPHCEWIFTHTTAAGRAKLLADFGDFARVAACPLDLPAAAREFIRRAKPDLAIFMEAEYWPNLLAAADESGANILLANARMGRANARKYAAVFPLTRQTIRRFAAAAAQTRADLQRLKFFGLRKGVVSGNLKFDRVPDPVDAALGKKRREKLRADGMTKPVVFFASVRAGEGEALIRAADDLFLREHFCVFAPRHPERVGEIASALRARGVVFSTDTTDGEIGAKPDVGAHLADSLGGMAAHYAMCDAAFVGGGLAGGFGGQNPIEAMAQGVAAATGPDSANYDKLVRSAARRGALSRARDAKDAIRLMRELCADAEKRTRQGANARAFCESQRGALGIAADLAEGLLPDGDCGIMAE